MHPIHTQTHSQEVQLSATALSPAAASGDVGRDLGYFPARTLQPPTEMLSSWHRFLAPTAGTARPRPQPSAMSQPRPRPPRTAV